MTTERETLLIIGTWMEDGRTRLPDHVLDAVLDQIPSTPQRRPLWSARRIAHAPRLVPSLGGAATLVVAAALALSVGVVTAPPPNVDLGIFEPLAGRIVRGGLTGYWGIDPGSPDPATITHVKAAAGVPLGWSSDGTRLLVQGKGNLFVLGADGSVTQVTEQLSSFNDIPGSGRPAGATIAPDGSRVAFAGLTTSGNDVSFCHDGALFAVDADGGPAELLWKSQRDGIVSYPSFSPDGRQIAVADGYCDSDHSVWVMNADGSDAHRIIGPIGAGHVRGLEWSPAGDRIALEFEGFEVESGIYTFATDGSDFKFIADAQSPHWSPDGSLIAYTSGTLAIADADGSNVRKFSYGSSGPWHPGTPSPSVEPTVEPAASPTVAGSPSADRSSLPGFMWPQSSLEEVRQAQDLADAGDTQYTWQVALDLAGPGGIGQNHPGDAKIFPRFLEEVLGWKDFRDGHHVPRLDGSGLDEGDFLFIRCAPAGTNTLYPDDPDATCAPTIDEVRYETVKITVAQLDRQGSRGIWVVTGWEMIGPAVQADSRVEQAEATVLVDAFLQARIDGAGAEELAEFADGLTDDWIDREVPLLYGTSTGASYERSELELVDGPQWPRGEMRFDVSLFAENDETVVEQSYSVNRDATGRLQLVYDFQSATTENGTAVPVEYGFLDGVVTYRAADPLTPDLGYRDANRVVISGNLPGDDFPREVLQMLADPEPIGPDCVAGPAPTDAEALARNIGSDPDFEATAPVAVTIGGRSALQLDVVVSTGAGSCLWTAEFDPTISETSPLLLKRVPFIDGPDRARLYLLDLPGGSARVLALVTLADEDSFEGVLEWAAPIVESIEFRTP